MYDCEILFWRHTITGITIYRIFVGESKKRQFVLITFFPFDTSTYRLNGCRHAVTAILGLRYMKMSMRYLKATDFFSVRESVHTGLKPFTGLFLNVCRTFTVTSVMTPKTYLCKTLVVECTIIELLVVGLPEKVTKVFRFINLTEIMSSHKSARY